MHLVHKKNESLLVLGFFFRASFNDLFKKSQFLKIMFQINFKISKYDNKRLDPLIDALEYSESHGYKNRKFEFNLFSILPLNLNRYFRYDGSLTTPPCTEGVKWNILDNHIKISSKQVYIKNT